MMNQKYDNFKQQKNLRAIGDNEIIFDVDDREKGFEAINFIGINLYNEGYNFQIWYAQGQKSPHLHIKDIVWLELEGEQLKRYKELILKKYCPEEYLEFLDFSLCPKHLIAEENKPHFKYKTIKKLCGIFNEDKENFAEESLIEQAQQTLTYDPDIKNTGLTAEIIKKISIVDIARQFGLDIRRNKTLCPFHEDNNTPSLVFYENQGRFCCFGCNRKGNIIKFYAMLKKLNPKFVYHMNSR